MATGNPQNDYYLNLRGYGQPTAVPQTNTGFGGYGSGYEPSVGGYPQSTPTDLTFGNGSSYAFGGQQVVPGFLDNLGTTLGGYGQTVGNLLGNPIGSDKKNPGWLVEGLGTPNQKGWIPTLGDSLSSMLGAFNGIENTRIARAGMEDAKRYAKINHGNQVADAQLQNRRAVDNSVAMRNLNPAEAAQYRKDHTVNYA